MPLLPPSLIGDLTSLFSSPPDNNADCASLWASAMNSYTAGIIPASATVSAAATALEAELLAAFDIWFTGNSLSCDLLETAFANFALLVGTGMLAASQYAAVPPPGLVGFCDIGTQSTHSAAAATFADKIDTWMKTGTATKVIPPFDTVNWS